MQLDGRIERGHQDLVLAAISRNRRNEVLARVLLERKLELDAVACVDEQGDIERQLAWSDEFFDLLALSVFIDFEVICGQTGHKLLVALRRYWKSHFQHADLLRWVIRPALLIGGLTRFSRWFLSERRCSKEQADGQDCKGER